MLNNFVRAWWPPDLTCGAWRLMNMYASSSPSHFSSWRLAADCVASAGMTLGLAQQCVYMLWPVTNRRTPCIASMSFCDGLDCLLAVMAACNDVVCVVDASCVNAPRFVPLFIILLCI